MPGLLVVACAILGLVVGSFLNVVIWRVPRKESLMWPASHCPACETPIHPSDNIPVASWLRLRGKCRQCEAPIPLRYPLVEVGCAVLFAATAIRFGPSWALPGYLVLFAALLATAVIDLEHYILPDRITFPLTLASIPLLALASFGEGDGHAFVRSLLGGLAFFAFFFLLNLLYPKGMGMGDVKLSFALGLYLGWLGWGELVLGGFLSFLLGAVISLLLLAVRPKGEKTSNGHAPREGHYVPFGPFLAAGTVIAVLWGEPVLRWYWGTSL
jgi:leader peptidase (prepilin peptidase)/N-methyltransferase